MTKSYKTGNRVGAHRISYAERFTWRSKLLVWVGAVVVLTVVGIFAIQSLGGDFSATDPQQDIVEPITDPAEAPEDTTVAVLNATGEEGGADAVVEAVTSNGWTPGIIAAAEEPVEHSTVFYTGDEYEPVALGVADQLGITSVAAAEGDLSGSPITVSVGQDLEEFDAE
ncbi:MAG TPA: LytR C-terminal domain-containing protein [Candidatus Agrococcus pullicola]|uniref:LytR C-terminal domain-containing protein n=1 Tax=Candidatus Agrococcus pullicola TaxID=2838429 RepID=A0A9D2C9S5_9MICO|nr:LytR C-terminal domain-containing protein [Candidatus Agrococcus pullicola]